MTAAAPVNNIIPISTVDGPGARTAIFLQGCNIACAYCHNPETQNLCIRCGICVPRCPAGALRQQRPGDTVEWIQPLCTNCGTCIQVCPHNASPKVRMMSAAEVMEQVRRSMPFIRGISVSGGECTLYPDFLTELFRLAKAEGLTCLIDTNGTVDLSLYPQLLLHSDGVMLDIKGWDPDVYRRLTGGDNGVVKKNLSLLARQGLIEELRIVCLEQEVDVEAIIDGAAAILGARARDTRLKLITFRKNGVRGRLQDMASPVREAMLRWKKHAQQAGFGQIVVV